MRLDIKEALSAILKFIKETHSGGLRDILKEIGRGFLRLRGGCFRLPGGTSGKVGG
jgi:hypothetical protein